MICIDTSSMIAYLQGTEGKDVTVIDHALLDQIAVFSPITLTELLSAPNLSTNLRQTFLAIPLLPLQDGFWERAGTLHAQILSKRAKARLADTLIAQTCLDHKIPLVTRDQDFQIFKRVVKLELL